jgi:hypothetical protein
MRAKYLSFIQLPQSSHDGIGDKAHASSSNVDDPSTSSSNDPIEAKNRDRIIKRKHRTVFNRMQIFSLEYVYGMRPYLSSAERRQLAARIGLSTTQVIGCIAMMYSRSHTTLKVT